VNEFFTLVTTVSITRQKLFKATSDANLICNSAIPCTPHKFLILLSILDEDLDHRLGLHGGHDSLVCVGVRRSLPSKVCCMVSYKSSASYPPREHPCVAHLTPYVFKPCLGSASFQVQASIIWIFVAHLTPYAFGPCLGCASFQVQASIIWIFVAYLTPCSKTVFGMRKRGLPETCSSLRGSQPTSGCRNSKSLLATFSTCVWKR
jgi:hypothetical protein